VRGQQKKNGAVVCRIVALTMSCVF